MKTIAPKIEKKKDSTFIITLTIDKSLVDAECAHVLSHLQQSYKSKGFRQGKVPLEIIKKEVDDDAILEEAANHLISHAYSDSIKQNGLKPIVQPKIKVLNPPITKDKSWEVEITGCEIPPITLDSELTAEVKKIEKNDKQLDSIIKLVVASSKTSLPSILIEAELNQRLTQLIDQTQQAGISIEAYLKSKKTSLEEFKSNTTHQIQEEWTLNLAVDKIAQDQKIKVDPKEIDEITTKNPNLKGNPNLVYYLLQQQKVFDYLKSL